MNQASKNNEKIRIFLNGNIGTWKGKRYSLPMKEDFQPYHAQEFPVPKIQ